MAFVLASARESTPNLNPGGPNTTLPSFQDEPPQEDFLSSALHVALSSLTNATAGPSVLSSSSTSDPHSSMPKDDKPHIDIILDSDCLFLKGTGVDVAPARLSGHVALFLTESTSIKEITLQFRGKAKLPIPQAES